MTREQMIDRMLASDADCNGRFLTGVLTTGIYCLPSCRARKPKPENVRFFRRPAAAEKAGLRPCKRCRPDYFYTGHDPDEARLEALLAQLAADPGAAAGVADLARRCGVGTSKLSELCRRTHHATPAALLARARIERACRELLAGDRPVAEIAFDVGFASLSVFNDRFRRRCFLSPQAYRALPRGSFCLELPGWFLAERVLAYVGRDPASVSETVRGRTIAFAVPAADRPAVVTVELGSRQARCQVHPPPPPASMAEVHRRVLRLLGLVIDPRPFERRLARRGELARLIDGRRGLSIPQTASPFDGLIWVIAGQQVSLPVACALRRRLSERLGTPAGEGLILPPSPATVAGVAPGELRSLGFSGRKSEVLAAICRSLAGGELDLEALARRPATAVERTLLAVRGLGPWSVHYLLMRAYGFVDCVPVGDVALARNLQRFFALAQRPDSRQVPRLMRPFAPYRSLATFHLWSYEEKPQ